MNTPTTITPREGTREATREPARTPEACRVERSLYRPAADIIETAREFTVRLDMPGLVSEEIDISVTGNELTITGRVAPRVPATKEARPLVREYGVGDFVRTFRVGEGINTADITAEYTYGVLTLTLPKTEDRRPRKINVRVN